MGKKKRNYAIVYCRVVSSKQNDKLERQVLTIQELYPEAIIIKEVRGGINYNRKGIKTLLELLLRGYRVALVVAHRDSFARFGTELF
ncbi:transposase [Vibrio phage F95]